MTKCPRCDAPDDMHNESLLTDRTEDDCNQAVERYRMMLRTIEAF
jgi:hypothetical protein